jgi:hypothetical protein
VPDGLLGLGKFIVVLEIIFLTFDDAATIKSFSFSDSEKFVHFKSLLIDRF